MGVKERNNRKTPAELLKNFSFQNKRDLKSLRWPKLFHPHAPAEDVKSFLGDTLWKQYTKVSLIRNPWDYLLSAYYWNPSNQNRKPFEQWIRENIQIVGGNNRQYYINGECVIDVFLRHEHLLSDLSALPVSEGDKQKVKLYLSKARFKSGFRKTDKSEETKMLKNASFPPFKFPLISDDLLRAGAIAPASRLPVGRLEWKASWGRLQWHLDDLERPV